MFAALPPAPTPEEQARDTLAMSPEAVYVHADGLLRGGAEPAAVRQQLIALGFDERTASTVVHDLLAAPVGPSRRIVPLESPAASPEALQAAGRRRMAWGALWFVGGLLITLGTLAAASSNGGSYVVAWGAIVYGAIEFFRGASYTSGQ